MTVVVWNIMYCYVLNGWVIVIVQYLRTVKIPPMWFLCKRPYTTLHPLNIIFVRMTVSWPPFMVIMKFYFVVFWGYKVVLVNIILWKLLCYCHLEILFCMLYVAVVDSFFYRTNDQSNLTWIICKQMKQELLSFIIPKPMRFKKIKSVKNVFLLNLCNEISTVL